MAGEGFNGTAVLDPNDQLDELHQQASNPESVQPGAAGAAQPGAAAATAAGTAPVAPGAGANAYDPTKTTPYDASQVAQFQAPTPAPVLDQPEPPNLGATSHTGALAYIGNNLLKGYLQGKAVRDYRNAVNMQRQSVALNTLHDQAASQYYDYAQQHGLDPQNPDADPTLSKLKDNVDATFNATMNHYKQHVEGMNLDKDGNLKKDNWWQKLTSNNPNDIAPATFQGMQQMGPAVYHQTQQFGTPEYRAWVANKGQQAGAQREAGAIGAGTAVTQAQTGQTQALTGQKLADAQQELLKIRTDPAGMTPESTERANQIQNAINYSNPAAKFTPIAGQKAYQHDGVGPYYFAVRDTKTGAVTERQAPPGFKPTLTTTQLPVEAVAYDEKGKPMWTAFSKETNEELPNSRNYTRAVPPSYLGKLTKGSYTTSDNAGNVTTRAVTSFAGPPGQVGQTAPGTTGPTEPGVAPTSGASPAAQSAVSHPGADPSNPVQLNTNSPRHGQQALPPAGTPAAVHAAAPGSPAKYAPPANDAEANKLDPTDPDWKPNANNPVEVWAQRVWKGGETNQDVKVPSQPKYLQNQVAQFMSQHNMEPGDIDTTAERTSTHAMRDAYPSINKTIGLLEKSMGITPDMTPEQKRAVIDQNNGPASAVSQWFKMGAYKNGVSPGDVSNQINQNVALDALTGTAPWTKIGRNKQIYADIQQHLPNVQKDSLGQMYDKLTGMRGIFDQQLGAYNSRHHLPGSTPEVAGPAPVVAPPAKATSADFVNAAGAGASGQQPGQVFTGASPANPAPVKPVTPTDHVFNVTQWQANPANRGKDVNKAIQKASGLGYQIVK